MVGERKQHMVSVAAELFSSRGYEATTVRDIGDRVGILSGSLYRHIRSKEDLLYEIVLTTGERTVANMTAIVESSEPALEKLHAAIRAECQLTAEELDRIRVFLRNWRTLSGDRVARVHQLRDDIEALWMRLITDGIADGSFRAVDPKFARLLVLSVLNWMNEWYRPDGELSAEQIADRFTDLIVHGLVAPPAP